MYSRFLLCTYKLMDNAPEAPILISVSGCMHRPRSHVGLSWVLPGEMSLAGSSCGIFTESRVVYVRLALIWAPDWRQTLM